MPLEFSGCVLCRPNRSEGAMQVGLGTCKRSREVKYGRTEVCAYDAIGV